MVLQPLLDRASAARKQMLLDLDGVRQLLGEPGAARRVAELAHAIAVGASG
jgi:hypothetical protein